MMMNISDIVEGVRRQVKEVQQTEIQKIFSESTVEVKYMFDDYSGAKTVELIVYRDNGIQDKCTFMCGAVDNLFFEGKRFLDYETASKIMEKHFPTLTVEIETIRNDLFLDLEIW